MFSGACDKPPAACHTTSPDVTSALQGYIIHRCVAKHCGVKTGPLQVLTCSLRRIDNSKQTCSDVIYAITGGMSKTATARQTRVQSNHDPRKTLSCSR